MGDVLLIQANSVHIPLKDQSCNMVCTSPPYLGLRDYQTGEWQGGDPACDHSRRTSTKETSFTTDSRPANIHGERQPWLGGVCGRCGATRIDQQIGAEVVHDCLGWAIGQGCEGQCYICAMRAVMREVWRVLRDDGTLWLVIGDSYANDAKWGGTTGGKHVNGLHGEPVGRDKRYTALPQSHFAACRGASRSRCRQTDGRYGRR